MAGGHSDRAHAMLGPSSAKRWKTCTPSARLESMFPESTSEAAAEGTLAHELCEAKLRHKFDPKAFSKKKLTAFITKCRKNPLWKNEMEKTTDEYVDTIWEDALSFSTMPMIIIEEKLDLTDWIPDGFGTCDCALIGDDRICVYDYKHGKGVRVDADHNDQEYIYALGMLKSYGWMADVKRVQLGIIQPRLPDGITKYECSLEEVLEYGENLKVIAQKAYNGEGDQVSGDHCRFCKAAPICKKRAEEALELAGDTGTPPELICKDQIGAYIHLGRHVADWVKKLEEYATAQLLSGFDIPGWKLVEGSGSRIFTDQEEAFKVLIENDVAKSSLYKTEPISLAQAETLVGNKVFAELVGKYVERKPGKANLVPESDKRAPLTLSTSAEEAFGDINKE